jgi:ABC-type branched-subunit amino acid transport system ATPase component
MTSLRKLNYHKIYLFESINTSNPLKEFIYFLKFNKVTPIDFSYSSEGDTLHSNLSITENFTLDAVPKSLIRDNENNLVEFISNLENPFLKELITYIGDLKKGIHELTKQQLKITSLTKAILSPSTYIFLNCPDKDLNPKLLALVKDCLQYENQKNNRSIFLRSHRQILWPDMIENIVVKNESHQYIVTKNPLLKVVESTKQHRFSLVRKAS